MAPGELAYIAVPVLADGHIPLLTPSGSPGVLYNPVAEGGVADQQDYVVHLWVDWAAEYARFVSAPTAGCQSHGNRFLPYCISDAVAARVGNSS